MSVCDLSIYQITDRLSVLPLLCPSQFFIMTQLDFSGNAVTMIGFIGIISTAIILYSVYYSYWNSPYRK